VRDVRLLTNDDLIALSVPAELVTAVEAALGTWEAGDAVVPVRSHLQWNGNTLLVMPSVARGLLGTKLVSVVPGNAARELPVTNGVMILNEGDTGLPLAVMNAAALTAVRTGAVGAVGLRHMTPQDVCSIGIVGCGVQGAWQAIFACAVRPVRKIFCVSRSRASIDRFRSTVGRHVPGVTMTPCGDVRELLAHTDVVIAATTSAEPVLPDDPALLAGKHFVSVGSYRPTMQELPDAVFRLAGHLVLDSDFARHEVGDAINPVEKGILTPLDVFPIGQLVIGRRSVDVTRTTACKSAGMALFDLFVAKVLYDRAKASNVGADVAI
jgi:ornithine cyclodeaminase